MGLLSYHSYTRTMPPEYITQPSNSIHDVAPLPKIKDVGFGVREEINRLQAAEMKVLRAIVGI